MFEDKSYSGILADMLSEVPSDVDKREGSIIFDTLSPAALELADSYINLDIILDNSFAETAEREYLILIAKERGLEPEAATNAVLKAEFNFNSNSGEYIGEIVSVGDRFNVDKINYILTEQLTNSEDYDITVNDDDGSEIVVSAGEVIPGCWRIMCETEGTEGNKHFGTLTPIETISGLTKAKITELLIPGEDEEDTETFRQRYFTSINSEAFGGNRADYLQWVKEMDGVGQVKAYRTPEGGGTVMVIITDSDNNIPSSELISQVKEALDPEEYEGLGYGIAPIGHRVIVKGVEECSVSVNASWETEDGVTVSDEEVRAVIEEYFAEVNSSWEDKTVLRVYSAYIIAKILDIDGVINVTDVYFNGNSGTQYVDAGTDAVFVLASLNGQEE
ncbi:MAG: baseplate J/gp47 family protein [Clostridiales bacterium]|nr:baseplate J/gp47 family protein [Clostridiales bacterium]